MAAQQHNRLVEAGQGTVLPPTELAHGEELLLAPSPEGTGFFQDPELAARVARLEHESKTLKNLASLSGAEGSIKDAYNKLHGDADIDEDILPVILRRNASIDTRKRTGLAAKINFARFRGYEVETLFSTDPVTDEVIPSSIRVEAKDRNDRADLNAEFEAFKDTYGGAKNRKARDARRLELQTQIAAIQLGTIAAVSS